MCPHIPTCPSADRPDRDAARVVALQPSQGWSLLCNGVILFDDAGEILPDGRAVPPPTSDRRAAPPAVADRRGMPAVRVMPAVPDRRLPLAA